MNRLFRVEICPLGCTKQYVQRAIFRFGISQSPGPARLLIYFSLLSSVNLSQAGMQRLFRDEKYLSGLYADGTFRAEYFFHL